ncbi:MAG: hypothetical protein UW45_C0030G0004 [Parcubacteria group bacterium GW2011_GWC2_44_22]|nr:MAG: hypothetical protein UW45_C0030G0004 [Parcubacteria group bacterium GW2011_GWC2_44_22]
MKSPNNKKKLFRESELGNRKTFNWSSFKKDAKEVGEIIRKREEYERRAVEK